MRIDNFSMIKLRDSLYAKLISNVDNDMVYCEMLYKRDRSSFAGMAFKVIDKRDGIVLRECEEKIVQSIGRYEKVYIGCEEDYINVIKDVFSLEEKMYGLEVLFLIYSDVRSSRIIFRELMENVNYMILMSNL